MSNNPYESPHAEIERHQPIEDQSSPPVATIALKSGWLGCTAMTLLFVLIVLITEFEDFRLFDSEVLLLLAAFYVISSVVGSVITLVYGAITRWILRKLQRESLSFYLVAGALPGGVVLLFAGISWDDDNLFLGLFLLLYGLIISFLFSWFLKKHASESFE